MTLAIVAAIAANLLLWLGLFLALVAWSLKQRGYPRAALLVPLLLLWLVTSRPFAELALYPLESRYEQPSVDALKAQQVRQVIVLSAGGFEPSSELASSTLTTGSSARFLGGLELCTLLGPDCVLILSGSAGRGHRDITASESIQMLSQRIAPQVTTRTENRSGSTAEHPIQVRPLLADGPFAVVTSAYHMPRAMTSFRRAGLDPIAFPVDQQIQGEYGWWDIVPSFGNLSRLQLAWREYLASLLYWLRGW
ncbi:MAG: ElyC/SanA/YdcF family protein [Acidobacteriota bacterium]